MFWTLLSMALCAFLVARLIFWTDEHRRESRWYYRVLLFAVTVYAASQVLDFIYHPSELTSPWLALFHLALVYGAFIVKPHYLPWNSPHDVRANQARNTSNDSSARLRYGMDASILRRGKATAGEREHRSHHSSQRSH